MVIMRHANLRKLDLNLLLLFETLMEEGSVTHVAERLFLTQAGVSHALTRLRTILKDELFVRNKGRMQPTARAMALAGPLKDALNMLDAALNPTDFNPAESKQTFRLVGTDYFATVILPKLIARLEKESPHADLRILSNSMGDVGAMLSSNDVDFAIGLKSRMTNLMRSECHMATLLEDEYVCVLRKGHEFARIPLTKSRYLKSKHILFSPTGSADYGIETYLRPMGIPRHIGVILSHHLAAPLILQNSDMIMTVPKRLAQFYVSHYDVRIVPLPLKMPPISIKILWNSQFDDHPAYRWFRSLIADICATINKPR
jgi:DNA-binding transcriptional LysR family regulator